MSDFSSLCPLFNTGVYNELTIPYISFSGCTPTMNALGGCITRVDNPGSFKFGRSVVVTRIYAGKVITAATGVFMLATRMVTSGTAAMTVFASLEVSTTFDVQSINRFQKMTQASDQTFLAADVLGFTLKTTKTDAGKYSFIVRYKEK